MADVGHKVLKYKSYLETNPNGNKVLYIFTRLTEMPITIETLQRTGIGKVVNSFRKRDSEIGQLAKQVVAKWKSMVEEEALRLAEAEAQESSNQDEDDGNTASELGHESASDEEHMDCVGEDEKNFENHKHKTDINSSFEKDEKLKPENVQHLGYNNDKEKGNNSKPEINQSEDKHRSSSSTQNSKHSKENLLSAEKNHRSSEHKSSSHKTTSSSHKSKSESLEHKDRNSKDISRNSDHKHRSENRDKVSKHSDKHSEHKHRSSEYKDKKSEHKSRSSENQDKNMEHKSRSSEHKERKSEHQGKNREKGSEHQDKSSKYREKGLEHIDKGSEQKVKTVEDKNTSSEHKSRSSEHKSKKEEHKRESSGHGNQTSERKSSDHKVKISENMHELSGQDYDSKISSTKKCSDQDISSGAVNNSSDCWTGKSEKEVDVLKSVKKDQISERLDSNNKSDVICDSFEQSSLLEDRSLAKKSSKDESRSKSDHKQSGTASSRHSRDLTDNKSGLESKSADDIKRESKHKDKSSTSDGKDRKSHHHHHHHHRESSSHRHTHKHSHKHKHSDHDKEHKHSKNGVTQDKTKDVDSKDQVTMQEDGKVRERSSILESMTTEIEQGGFLCDDLPDLWSDPEDLKTTGNVNNNSLSANNSKITEVKLHSESSKISSENGEKLSKNGNSNKLGNVDGDSKKLTTGCADGKTESKLNAGKHKISDSNSEQKLESSSKSSSKKHKHSRDKESSSSGKRKSHKDSKSSHHKSKRKHSGDSDDIKPSKSRRTSSQDGMSFEDLLTAGASVVEKPQPKKMADGEYEKLKSKFKVKKKGDNSQSEVPIKKKKMDDTSGTDQMQISKEDVLGALPQPNTHYRPWRFNEVEKKQTEEELLDSFIRGTKNTRTQMYSGKKQNYVPEVYRLYNMCMNVLSNNIDSLEFVGGVPYDILKPILEKCTVAQLYKLEDYNPQFLQSSDELWMIHSQKDFKMGKPDEMETWREYYLRKYDEREEKLKKVSANISASMAKKVPERSTKLAYIDSAAKPPRNVRRQQAKYGTAGPSSGERSKARFLPSMDPIPVGRSTQKVVKPSAPMMAKTLTMIKKMRR